MSYKNFHKHNKNKQKDTNFSEYEFNNKCMKTTNNIFDCIDTIKEYDTLYDNFNERNIGRYLNGKTIKEYNDEYRKNSSGTFADITPMSSFTGNSNSMYNLRDYVRKCKCEELKNIVNVKDENKDYIPM